MCEKWIGLIYQNQDLSDRFEISNIGRLKNIKTGKILKLNIIGKGYLGVVVSLGSRKNKKMIRVHRAVAESFIPNPESKEMVNHKDGNKINNCINNLEWVTNSENMKHAYNTGLKTNDSIKGELSNTSKLRDDDIRYIKKNYKPRDPQFGCRALGRKYGVTHNIISGIVNGKRWTHII